MADLKDIKLSAQDILKKQFRNKVKGYDPDEVDHYLDDIISDYEHFGQVVEDLYGKIGDLQGQLLEAQKAQKAAETRAQNAERQVQALEAQQAAPVAPAPAAQPAEEIKTYTPQAQRYANEESIQPANGEISTNMAIIQRISTLERKVYNLEQRVYGLQNR
ncbi:DivIVA domain-containing protein [Lactobacillus corticis]|uniref:Cell division protein GpsB n=1 Tax=Lactobacillus corticis TaxID=2201249 RepID=A0A916VHT9_9LACO|nr:DivIVA domain-containing protein [Lactobacillus corticis]GFZ27017.1 cell division protein GpsB [Lactobacillus corticis]